MPLKFFYLVSMSKGKVSGQLSSEETKRLIEKVREIKRCLPFLIQLTPQQRKGGLKAGDRSVVFIEKALQIAKERKDLIPPYIDVEELQRDFELWKNLDLLIREVASLLEALEDTRMAAGADAYAAALLIYGALKQAAQSGVPGADTLVQTLSTHFERTLRPQNDEPNPS